MELKQKHVSPDGQLTLLVFQDGEDWLVGFDNSQWHTHGDLLSPTYGSTPEAATQAFVAAILDDRELISVSTFPDKPSVISVTDDQETEEKYKLPEETLLFRYWSGKDDGRST